MTGAGDRLRAARESVGMGRAELAVASGLSRRMVEAVERGECGASQATAAAFEKALLRAALARVDRIEDAIAAVARLDAAADSSEVRA
jgi:transcriptional regulator with XRE-family HTH domain